MRNTKTLMIMKVFVNTPYATEGVNHESEDAFYGTYEGAGTFEDAQQTAIDQAIEWLERESEMECYADYNFVDGVPKNNGCVTVDGEEMEVGRIDYENGRLFVEFDYC